LLTGKQFKLERGTLAVEVLNGKPTAVTVPGGSIIKVLSGPEGDGLVKVAWGGRTLGMFAVDVDVRGTQIEDQSVKTNLSPP
jgi:hypothetical protein